MSLLSHLRPGYRFAVLLSLASAFTVALAQPLTPATQDPMMQLMLSQPKIDVDSPVVPQAAFEPPAIKPGEQATYRVTLNALETAIEWPDQIPTPPQLRSYPGARGQILSLGGAFLIPRTTFNYRIYPSGPGQFSIPEFKVMVNGKAVAIPAARLEVTNNPPPVAAAQRLIFQIPTNGLVVGQTVRARVLLPGSPTGVVQSLGQVQINGQGFIVDQSSAHARIESIPVGGSRRLISAFVYELLLTPIATGKLTLFAQGYAVGNRIVGGVIIPGSGSVNSALPQYTLLDSDPVTLDIKPLPRGSELPGFTGAVGIYSVDPPELSTNMMAVGEPIRLKVKVRGDGNLARLVPPGPPAQNEWQIFAAPLENNPPQIVQAQGFVTFIYTLIPLTDKTRATPAIPFCAFDPDHNAYDDLSIAAVPVQVMPGSVSAADLRTVIQASRIDKDPEKEPVLSGLATAPGMQGGLIPFQKKGWFPLLHLVPASALMALWWWDRRRRFFEHHPEIVLRRRALRALRRQRKELQRAAKSNDSAGFAALAVTAMKTAVAPYFPAEPRALVGADVLFMLPEQDRSGIAGSTVRQLFHRSDAEDFGGKSNGTADLLKLKPEIEAILDRLEARLWC